jgi:hypothetical protein
MDVRPLRARTVALSEPAMRGLQTLAQLHNVSAEQLLEQLILGFLEFRTDEVEQIARDLAGTSPAVPRGPAKVIDMEERRRRRSPETPSRPQQRSQALRQQAGKLVEQSRAVRALSREALAHSRERRGRGVSPGVFSRPETP